LLSQPLGHSDSFHHQINHSSQGSCLNGKEHLEPGAECLGGVEIWREELKNSDSEVYLGQSHYMTFKREVLPDLARASERKPGRRSDEGRTFKGNSGIRASQNCSCPRDTNALLDHWYKLL
jgi:hypothetical protein